MTSEDKMREIFERDTEWTQDSLKEKAISILHEALSECIKEVESSIRPGCEDHTPYMGACLTCGSVQMPDDLIKNPEALVERLKKHYLGEVKK